MGEVRGYMSPEQLQAALAQLNRCDLGKTATERGCAATRAMILRLPKACLEQTLSHLRAVLPNEGVGLWVGHAGQVVAFWPLHNVHVQPRERYEAHPQALIQALARIERERLELVAIVHSHPNGPANPSQTDRTQAFWRVPYAIFDMRTERFRAFWLPHGEEVSIWLEAL